MKPAKSWTTSTTITKPKNLRQATATASQPNMKLKRMQAVQRLTKRAKSEIMLSKKPQIWMKNPYQMYWHLKLQTQEYLAWSVLWLTWLTGLSSASSISYHLTCTIENSFSSQSQRYRQNWSRNMQASAFSWLFTCQWLCWLSEWKPKSFSRTHIPNSSARIHKRKLLWSWLMIWSHS